MHSLLATNLDYLRGRAAAADVRDPQLVHLWQAALAGDGEVLRISPQRTVFCMSLPSGKWLLKIYHPRRSLERARRLIRSAPAVREAENWALLAHRLNIELPILVEQVQPALGLFARPFWQGRRVSTALEDSSSFKTVAEGLARLHRHHWSDRDLSADDLLFADAYDGQVLPLDLGHAKVGLMKPSPEMVYRDLQNFIASIPVKYAQLAATEFLRDSLHGAWLKDYSVEKLVKRSIRQRTDQAWKRSSRCLRTVSDFERGGRSSIRRNFDGTAPLPEEAAEVVKSGPRSSTQKHAEAAWKFYPRSGAVQKLRKQLLLGPGCLAFRKLYFLELLGFKVAAPQAWHATHDGEWLATSWLSGSPPTASLLPQIAAYLARLHMLGIGLRDAKPQNFVVDSDANGALTLALIDADGIRPQLRNPWRDLARVLAECELRSELQQLCSDAYLETWQQTMGTPAPWSSAEVEQKTASFAAHFRDLLAK